jgi:hypothetical protein
MARAATAVSVWLVSITTGQAPEAITWRAASTPSPSGSPTAMMTTSGRCFPTRCTTSSTRLPLPFTCPPCAMTASATAAREGA